MKTVFIVDDNDTNLMSAKIALDGTYKTYALPSAIKMFALIEKIMPDLILLDIDMPDMDGFKAMEILQSDNRLKSIPVIFLTALNNPEAELRGLEMGAVDYITKPFSKPVLLKRIDTQINLNKSEITAGPVNMQSTDEVPKVQENRQAQSIPLDLNLNKNLNVNFIKGSYIILEDKRVPTQFYIILKGKVSLYNESHITARKKIDTLEPGDFFGVISAMSGHSQIETARALTDVVLMPIRSDNFNQFIQENAQMANKILIEFSKKMSSFNDLLAGLTFKKRSKLNTNILFNVAEYYANQKQYENAIYAYQKFIKTCPDDENIEIARDHLKQISVFENIEVLHEKSGDNIRIYPKNTLIFCEGESGDEIFFIKSGMVKISKIVDKREILLAVLTKGDIFGEMALLESKSRDASAVAYEESEVMVVSSTNFENLIKTQPLLVSRLTSLLAKRLWIMNKKISNTQISDPVGRMMDMLFIQLEMKRVNTNTENTFTFDFGPLELINMIGLSPIDGGMAVQKLVKFKYMGLSLGKIAIKDMPEFIKHVKYYRSTQQ